MVPGRTEPKIKKCIHVKKEIKRHDNSMRLQQTYYPKIRNSGGKVMKFSKETKRLWKKIKNALTIQTFIKYANLWILSIEKDSENVKETDYALKLGSDGNIHRSRGGFTAPKVVIVENTTYKEDGKTYGQFGAYHTHIIAGINQIELCKTFRTLTEIKKTLIHEALHYIDERSKTPSNHDCYFQIRLKRMEEIFKI